MERLKQILSYARGHNSDGEAMFIADMLLTYEVQTFLSPAGEVLAYRHEIAGADGTVPPVLFCSHIDTVHPVSAPVRQNVLYDEQCGMMYKDDGMPLGADDGAGVWLMMEMIDAGVPGAYLFHRGEECGGIGSRGMAKYHADVLTKYQWAIQFDRRGTEDVITEMACGVTCHTKFAEALARKLNGAIRPGLKYAPCNSGIFTDTANYRGLIPECTNVSVGYDDEHTGGETLDCWHLEQLRGALVRAFTQGTGDLPVHRTPNDDPPDYGWVQKYGYGPVSGASYADDGFVFDPCDAQTVLTMKRKDLLTWIDCASREEIADLLDALAQEVEYWQEEGFNERRFRETH